MSFPSDHLFTESAPFEMYVMQAAPAGGNPIFTFGFLGLMIVVFYFLLIRPQQKRRKEHAALVSSLSAGDEVVTVGGVIGRVTKVEDEHYVRLQVARNIEFRVQKHAVNATLPQGTIKSLDGGKPANEGKSSGGGKSSNEGKSNGG